MEPQEAFDTMVAHLCKQGKKSEVGDGQRCLYRGPDGLKCAVGCLLPDKDYDPGMDGVAYDFKKFPYFEGWSAPALGLMSRVQLVHDHCSPSDWESEFERVALDHDLKLTPKTETKTP